MEATQTLSQGLKQEFKVVLPAGELSAKLERRLAEVRAKAHIHGFRPGKAPISHLKRLYGKGVMGEILQEAVTEANRKIIEDNSLRIALEPRLDFTGDKEEMEKALEAEGDFSYSVTFEILPAIEVGSFDDVALERPVAAVGEEDVARVIADLAARARKFEEKTGEDARAAKGDRLTLDFVGKIDGVPFKGGARKDIDLMLGSGAFLPGFEEQLEGAAKGEQRVLEVRFPEGYAVPELAGRQAEFDVTVHDIAAPEAQEIDDAFAAGQGFKSLAEMQNAVRAGLEADYAKASRAKLKRALLDVLDRKFAFEIPEGLVEQELSSISKQLEPGVEDEAAKEATRAEYRGVAERRVRLGLVLAEIGQKAGVKVEDEDVTNALVEHVRRFPGREKEVWEYYRKNPQALAEIRAPLFEEQVVDHILDQIEVVDRSVPREELFAADEEKPVA